MGVIWATEPSEALLNFRGSPCSRRRSRVTPMTERQKMFHHVAICFLPTYLCCSALLVQHYSIIDLLKLPNAIESRAFGLNDNGRVLAPFHATRRNTDYFSHLTLKGVHYV